MADSYVCSKAKIQCSCGDRISTLTVYPDRTIWLTGQPQANISDHISMRNIAPFGRCHTTAFPPTSSATAANHGTLTPMPCIPNTPFPWMGGKDDVLLKGQPALLKSSKCKCIYGGTITITFDGQIASNVKDLPHNPTENLEDEGISVDDVLDGIQSVLDIAGFVPGFGAVPDLLNAAVSACRGKWADAGLNLLAAIPGLGDAAKAASMASKAYKSTKAVANVSKVAKQTNKIARKQGLVKEAKKFVEIEVTESQLLKQGLSESDADFFLKKVRYYRKEAARDVYSKAMKAQPDRINIFNVESHLNGIDFSSALEIGVAKKGTKMNMYVSKDIYGNIGSPGNYAFKVSDGITSSEQLGVASKGVFRKFDTIGKNKQKGQVIQNVYYKKEMQDVILTDDVWYVKSRSRKITDTWSDPLHPRKTQGGGLQYFLIDSSKIQIL